MNIVDIPCNRENYGGLRGGAVEYIVVHYTGVPGDRARSNGEYFGREDTGKTSAHYFVDEAEIVRSVPEEYVAYHCGGSYYYHSKCRNGNSIGVEICTRWRDGKYVFDDGALENAAWLIRGLMKKYAVPLDRVIRHWDVTHKVCPAPFVGEGHGAWEEFKGGLMRYNTIEELPGWATATGQKLLEKDILRGDGNGLDLSQDMVRMLVILDRAGVFDKQPNVI